MKCTHDNNYTSLPSLFIFLTTFSYLHAHIPTCAFVNKDLQRLRCPRANSIDWVSISFLGSESSSTSLGLRMTVQSHFNLLSNLTVQPLILSQLIGIVIIVDIL